jgi:hypothetical protein
LACGGLPAAAAEDRAGLYAPYENLAEVLADFSRHLRDDLYRFQAPRDMLGRSLFAVTLERLDNFRTLRPHEMRDVVGFARAEAFLRLGNYAAAARGFATVAELETPLAATAQRRYAITAEMADVSALPERGPTLETTLEMMRAKLEQWDRLVERTRGTPDEWICQVEEERIEQRLLTTVIDNRAWLDDGTETAVRSATFLIAKHAESKNAPTHVIRLGDLQAALAREYADAHSPATFEEQAFSDRVAHAVEAYARIASLDGVPQKPEAQAKLAAMHAYREQVLSLRQ